MRRRLTVAMVVMVLVTLVLSGVVSLFLAQRTALNQTRRELVQEATALAAEVQQESSTQRNPALALRRLLAALKPAMRLDGAVVVVVGAAGRLYGVAPVAPDPVLPSGLTTRDLRPLELYGMHPVSGRSGGFAAAVVYAAVPYRADIQVLGESRQEVQAVVLTRKPPSALATAGPWFALSALVILAASGVVARRLGQQFTAPVLAAQEVAGRIAAGDLDARVPDTAGTDPELAALGSSVNSMAEGLARAKAAERHFLQSVSHDLRTPLTSIRGFAEAIEDGATGDVVAAAGVIASEARRLERLVGDLLALATLEARRFTLQPEPVDLVAAVARGAAGFEPAATELGLTLVAEPGPPAFALADPDRLAQVVANLIENALRYAGSGVHVGAAAGPGGVSLWVSDDGPGISAADLPKVFDRLYGARRQPDGARPGRPIGSGLGLTIVSELVGAMGGSVRAESPLSEAGGTRMVVVLPAALPRQT
ncbi:MAG TPA: HAMP domain-containing sensor histidine kinase [Acidimicrobiales bacterium]|nr:HAMP domain-containing sensor histidine kinase [Acidimicrobiales bacterium]